jgi:lysophospholipase L1-like esterase
MKRLVGAFTGLVLLTGHAFAAEPECDVPDYLLAGDSELNHVAAAAGKQHVLSIVVLGTGSSFLSGPAGADAAYPARLGMLLKAVLPKVEIKVVTHAKSRQTAADMFKELEGIIAQDKPDLVIWQTGTFDAIRGVEPEEFRAVLDEGVETLQNAGADVILMNMQYSPRTESVMALDVYNEHMHLVARERAVPLFDRLAIMKYWSDGGVFDLHAATKGQAMAQRVHDCIGHALTSLVVEAAHLKPPKPQEEKAPH